MADVSPHTFRDLASDPAAPAAGKQTLYSKTAGLFRRASSGGAKRLLDSNDLTSDYSFAYTYSTTTTEADPGTGIVRFNASNLSAATSAYLDDVDASGGFAKRITEVIAGVLGEAGPVPIPSVGQRSPLWLLVRKANVPEAYALFEVAAYEYPGSYFKLSLDFYSGDFYSFADGQALVLSLLSSRQSVVSSPFLRSGYWYGATGARANASNVAMTQDLLRLNRFVLPRMRSFDRIGFIHGSNVAGSSYRLGVYEDNGSDQPGALVLDAGTVSTASGGGAGKTITIALDLPAGVYWLAGVAQGGNPTIGRWATGDTNWDLAMPAQSSQLVSVIWIPAVVGFSRSGVSGALPDPIGGTLTDLTYADTNPVIQLRAA